MHRLAGTANGEPVPGWHSRAGICEPGSVAVRPESTRHNRGQMTGRHDPRGFRAFVALRASPRGHCPHPAQSRLGGDACTPTTQSTSGVPSGVMPAPTPPPPQQHLSQQPHPLTDDG